jgi:hypothetical protein
MEQCNEFRHGEWPERVSRSVAGSVVDDIGSRDLAIDENLDTGAGEIGGSVRDTEAAVRVDQDIPGIGRVGSRILGGLCETLSIAAHPAGFRSLSKIGDTPHEIKSNGPSGL